MSIRLLHRLRSLFRAREMEHELDDEMQEHLARSTALYVSRGMSEQDARIEARRNFGNMSVVAEQSRDSRGTRWVDDRVRDVRFALRTLRRSPGVSIIAVVTLALGIGANTAIFTVVNGILLRPLAYENAEQLVAFQYGENSTAIAPGVYFDWQRELHSYSGMGAAEYWTPTLGGIDRPQQITALHVTSGIFPLLGVQPILGRTPTEAEEHAGQHRVIVLRHDLWQTRFGGDSQVMGRAMTLNGEPYTIIGVMPKGFVFAPYWATEAQMWAPFVLDDRRTDREASSARIFARMRDGVTLTQARAELATVGARLERAYPGTNKDIALVPLHEKVVGNVRNALMILQVAVALVMLIACANVAHLQLMRAAARQREFAVRTALGASRARLVVQSLVESLMLSTTGGVLGFVLAVVGVRGLILISPPELPRLDTIGIDARAFVFLLVVVLAATVAFGVAPALSASRVDLHGALKEGGRNVADSAKRRRFRGVLVGSEFAMALVLLVSAGLVIKSFAALLAIDTGFHAKNLASINVSLKGTAHEAAPQRSQFYRELLERIQSVPGVEHASAINHAPLTGDNWHLGYSIEGRELKKSSDRSRAQFLVVRPDYFRTMGVSIKQGREFSRQDIAAGAHVAIINEYMARQEWPNGGAVGQRISVDDPAKKADWYTVVGVVSTVHQIDLTGSAEAQMYFAPVATDSTLADQFLFKNLLDPKDFSLVIQSRGAVSTVAASVEQTVRSMDRDALVSTPIALSQAIDDQFTQPKFYLLILSLFAAVALTLAAVGIYGVISYSVARRQHEIGVRMALGAERSAVFKLIVAQGMQLALVGGTFGVIAALVLTRFLRTLLFGIQPNDPLTFVVVSAVLMAAALAACGIPARRATRIDPVTALRSE